MDVLPTVLLAAGGPALIITAPVYLARRLRFRGTAVRAKGTVERSEGFSDDVVRTLTIRFTASDGREHVFVEEHAPRRPVGREVPVLYDPAHPDRARLHRKAFLDILTAAAMLLIGAVFTYAHWLT